jgi:hypothetical protein
MAKDKKEREGAARRKLESSRAQLEQAQLDAALAASRLQTTRTQLAQLNTCHRPGCDRPKHAVHAFCNKTCAKLNELRAKPAHVPIPEPIHEEKVDVPVQVQPELSIVDFEYERYGRPDARPASPPPHFRPSTPPRSPARDRGLNADDMRNIMGDFLTSQLMPRLNTIDDKFESLSRAQAAARQDYHIFQNPRQKRDHKKLRACLHFLNHSDVDSTREFIGLLMDNTVLHDANDGAWQETEDQLTVSIQNAFDADFAKEIIKILFVPKVKSKTKKRKENSSPNWVLSSPPPAAPPPAAISQIPPGWSFNPAAISPPSPLLPARAHVNLPVVEHNGSMCKFCTIHGSVSRNCHVIKNAASTPTAV